MEKELLKINDLQTHFFSDKGVVKAVDGVTITVNKGETVGIVGESGCGKSVTSLSIMRLLKDTPGKIVGGSIQFEGKDLIQLPEKNMRSIRGNEIAMIFQEPMTSLNPVYKIGRQLVESIRLHMKKDANEAKEHAIKMLELVGIPRAREIMKEYPHQLSGGMRQRVMIAMAMSCNPKLLIADEPTTALDVTIQAQILDLMRKLREESDSSILLITHDLGVVAEMCDRVVIMYAGKVVEESDVNTIFENPKHPYTKGLLESIPKLGVKIDRLQSIKGNVPAPEQMPKGCKFAPRCPFVMDQCWEREPQLQSVNANHTTRCWLHQKEGAQ
ncbi:ABC transporter ATP-binding protein [Heyndrickxia oleronia]|uniref:Peptide ABC transporter ATP-binding protein n=1 Tax=Heyndrickxia oleronia TaxID=38875 RepID=A0A8E2IFP5_9BACI|nr:ABC transporter ATP-binding protein [Heyndrickxia oleronia]NYV65582.1 ABC transporter ATP-binding protein [Bacillus sp. Gen3]OJH20835.1 peptide ABC transporter ATP-binding protein [Bacillus obstructivus]MBU5211490.1 ABC transporter ATP-binding protein [Heyndrickxia oleronia]MEC1375995.1 ABC transporter ATP-binding protein [Heyndrickxia oleronia]OOP70265.1 peptide ABC transporter ATP-binding protein [Heyndrickxia oleronia]